VETLERAIETWQNSESRWWEIVRRSMIRNMSWDVSAQEYQQLYQTVHQKAGQKV
jgi:glycogen synthase